MLQSLDTRKHKLVAIFLDCRSSSLSSRSNTVLATVSGRSSSFQTCKSSIEGSASLLQTCNATPLGLYWETRGRTYNIYTVVSHAILRTNGEVRGRNVRSFGYRVRLRKINNSIIKYTDAQLTFYVLLVWEGPVVNISVSNSHFTVWNKYTDTLSTFYVCSLFVKVRESLSVF